MPSLDNFTEVHDFKRLSGGRTIVSMIQYGELILVATEDQIYTIKDGKAEVLKLKWEGNG